jgi:hypothetical protein
VLTLPTADVNGAPPETIAYAAATLLALAREEREGRRQPRLTEAGMATWNRFRGRLGARALLELLLEDAAVRQPFPFDVARALGSADALATVPDPVVAAWVDELARVDLATPAPEYVAAQAKTLGVSTRGAKAELHRVKPFHKILELPGSGGQLAHHMAHTQPELSFRDAFTVACANRAEWTLAGLVAVERTAAGDDLAIVIEPSLDAWRGKPFDYVVGLSLEKRGAFSRADLAAVFPPSTTLLLV